MQALTGTGVILRIAILTSLVTLFLYTPITAQIAPDPEILSTTAPDTFQVLFETTNGDFTVTSYRDWSPLGADRLYHLVLHDYYIDVPFYRVITGRFAQFGNSPDQEVNDAWNRNPIEDEPVVASNTLGRMHFARGGPETRSQHLSIMIGENAYLDTVDASGIIGFVPIAEVTDGMDVVLSLYAEYGDEPRLEWNRVRREGMENVQRTWPNLDYIKRATIINR
ncbi:MAG: peptidylprolyl isomerase [Balneolaceae bacterium]